MSRTVGPVILDLIGSELQPEEREMLQHPLVGGVILFARNYESPEQITQLNSEIRRARNTPLLIAVDQEGGRVQRFQTGFTRLPPMRELGEMYDEQPQLALLRAEHCGWLMASELLAVGVDMSFAPVLDLDKGLNTATAGGRPFHQHPRIVVPLAKAFIRGMHQAGMAATGKHFPGHGSVTLDSHHAMPIDERSLGDITVDDLIPFAEIQADLDAVMPAHILFPAVDEQPVGFSAQWLKKILRQQLHFSGIIFSDDLNMEGAGFAGDYKERAHAALTAGCDMVLICNNRKGAVAILDQLPQQHQLSLDKIKPLQGKTTKTLKELKLESQWQMYQKEF